MTQSTETSSALNYSRVALMVGVPVVLVGVAGYYYMYRSKANKAEEKNGDHEEAKRLKTLLSPAQQAISLKEAGNKYFRQKQTLKALDAYSQAIEQGKHGVCSPKDMATFYQNRAATHEILEDYQSVVHDCTEALKHDKQYLKALMRRARALEKLDNYDDAIVDATAANIVSQFSQEALHLLDRLLEFVCRKKAVEAMKLNKNPRKKADKNKSEAGLNQDNEKSREEPEENSAQDESRPNENSAGDESKPEEGQLIGDCTDTLIGSTENKRGSDEVYDDENSDAEGENNKKRIEEEGEEEEEALDQGASVEAIQARWNAILEGIQSGTMELDEIEKNLERESKVSTTSVVPHCLLGMFKFQVCGEPLKAVDCFKAGIEIDGKCKVLFDYLAGLYIQLGNIDAGLEAIQASLKLAKTEMEYAQTYSMLVSAHAQQKAFKNLGMEFPEAENNRQNVDMLKD